MHQYVPHASRCMSHPPSYLPSTLTPFPSPPLSHRGMFWFDMLYMFPFAAIILTANPALYGPMNSFVVPGMPPSPPQFPGALALPPGPPTEPPLNGLAINDISSTV